MVVVVVKLVVVMVGEECGAGQHEDERAETRAGARAGAERCGGGRDLCQLRALSMSKTCLAGREHILSTASGRASSQHGEHLWLLMLIHPVACGHPCGRGNSATSDA